jgi:hypothetical protein
MATEAKTTGALPALPAGMSLADPEVKQRYNESIEKVLASLENRSQIPWFKIAAALGDPGRTGSAGEAFGKAFGVMGQHQEEERARQLPIAQMRAQLAGQQYEMSKEEKALNAFANALGTTPQNLQQGMASGQFNPMMMQKLNAAMPQFYGSPKIMEMAKTMFGQFNDISKTIMEERKLGLSEADLIAKYGEDIKPLLRGATAPMMSGQATSGQTTAGGTAGSPISVPYTTGDVSVAADANNPSGIKPGGKFAVFETPELGVQATQQLVDSYLRNPSRNTPESLVGTWVTGNPTEGAKVQNGAYAATVRRELENAGIRLDQNGKIPNTPEANAAVTRAIIFHESGADRAKPFLPLVGTDFQTAQAQGETATPPAIRTATEAMPSPKILSDRIEFPDGRVIERGASSLESWNKLKQSELESYNRQREADIAFERERIKSAGAQRDASVDSKVKELGAINPDDISRTQGMLQSFSELMKDPQMASAVGLMFKQGAGPAMYALAKDGLRVGNFGVSVDFYNSVVKTLPKESQEKLRQAEMLLSELFIQKAREAKSAFGPQISNFDILMQKERMASIRDTPKIINNWLTQERTTAQHKTELSNAYMNFLDSATGTNKKPSQFFNSPEYKNISKKYGQIYQDLGMISYGAPR